MTREERDELRLRLRASRLELVEDIAAREEQLAADHDAIVAVSRDVAQQRLVFKTHDSSANGFSPKGEAANEPFTELQVDIIAQALADIRVEAREMLAAELAAVQRDLSELRDELAAVLRVLRDDNNARAGGRKRSGPQLLEPPGKEVTKNGA